MREPQDWPLFTMDGRRYSFFDCTCDEYKCIGVECDYCQWMKEECPNAEESSN